MITLSRGLYLTGLHGLSYLLDSECAHHSNRGSTFLTCSDCAAIADGIWLQTKGGHAIKQFHGQGRLCGSCTGTDCASKTYVVLTCPHGHKQRFKIGNQPFGFKMVNPLCGSRKETTFGSNMNSPPCGCSKPKNPVRSHRVAARARRWRMLKSRCKASLQRAAFSQALMVLLHAITSGPLGSKRLRIWLLGFHGNNSGSIAAFTRTCLRKTNAACCLSGGKPNAKLDLVLGCSNEGLANPTPKSHRGK